MGQQGSKDRAVPRRTDFTRDSAKMRLGSFKRGRRGWICGDRVTVILPVCVAVELALSTTTCCFPQPGGSNRSRSRPPLPPRE